MKVSERSYCSFPIWYPLFRNVTFKSLIEEIPVDVLKYLNEDGVVLPSEALSNGNACCQSYFEGVNDGEVEEVGVLEQPSFPEFSDKLQSSVDNLGGEVFIKANWSAPTDASWIIPNKNLKCTTLEDIYLLLKTSDRLQENLQFLKNGSGSCYIILRKWEDVHPSSEFRCFVFNNHLIGITQRDCSAFHKYILDTKDTIINDISEFFSQHIKDKYPLRNFVFDVLWAHKGKMMLVDFGQFDRNYTESYLFTWDYLLNIADEISEEEEGTVCKPEFCYVATDNGVQPNEKFTGFEIPYDLVNMDGRVKESIISIIQSEVVSQEKLQNFTG